MIAAAPKSAWVLLIGGLAGWIASFTLTVERFKLFVDPAYQPSCSLNPILSCGSVMTTDQAALFGFPNPIIGVAGFAVVVTLAVLAVAGVALPRWIWIGLWLGTVAGTVFICWLIFQSLYRIGALCPYCMVVWAIITPLLAVVTQTLWGGSRGPMRVVAEWRWTFVALFYAVVLLLIFLRFQDYWLSLV
ncbi:vitamin K epoxide reductase family protein [Nocardia cyriacigeorgica]|uniref:vitamin K epoxide reductase family protein n=1 Tax=Nocardia cyriacigeorgica TaxID=135487 RepID=UPI0024584F95|nr:vitamin K epoxide reductase family protein [Nocardia cyriacigeorgica]